MKFNWFAADVDKRKKRLLAEAENDLLDAEKGLEDAVAIADAFRKRVTRLRADVQEVLMREAIKVNQARSDIDMT